MKSHLLFCFVVAGDQGCFLLRSCFEEENSVWSSGIPPGSPNPKRVKRKRSLGNMQKSFRLRALFLFQRAEDYGASVAGDIVFDAVLNHQKSNRHRRGEGNGEAKNKHSQKVSKEKKKVS
ncbi:hypothetical protein TNCT_476481 [Trichonephila clavata]|uniref:Uncharacterized protein n=1 Tax=Trichonephila clavata TaxID=2740835 RepID=A0A8X6FYG8_TRICU|nr:hypothetical protein TNCT_476481 [Trichonephila clavata]